MYVERHLSDRLRKLSENFPVVALCGARQSGKSTLLSHLFAESYRSVVFDPVIDIQNARAEPDLFLSNNPAPLILDEIQYAPEVVASIKRYVDRGRKPGMYLLCGSQQWAAMKSLSESLAGRVVFLDLAGFSAGEIARVNTGEMWVGNWLESKGAWRPRRRLPLETPLIELIFRGGLPQATFLSIDLLGDFFAGYERTYIERDARLMSDFADIRTFGRFFRLAAALTAREINQHQLGRELGVTPQTAHRWISVLQATYQWFEIPAFSGNSIKRLSGKAKGYVADTGMACFAQAIASPQSLPNNPLWGALFETHVVVEIKKQLALLPYSAPLYHWRTHGGAEVDLIIEHDGILYPIEIKATSHPSKADTSGITAFRKTYPRARIGTGVVVCAAEISYPLTERDVAMPWDAAL